MHSCHSCSSIVHRALVTYSNSATGEIRVKIPVLLGSDSEVALSTIGRKETNGSWVVPSVGDQIIVSADDENMTNVFWLQTEPYNGTVASTEASVTSLENLVDVTLTNPVNGETLVYNGSQWVNTSSQTIRYFNARDLVPTSSDVGKLIIMDSGSWVQTVQIDSDLGLTPGQRIDFVRIGTNAGGTVTFSASGVVLNGTPSLQLRARYSAATVICLFTNQYLLVGDLG